VPALRCALDAGAVGGRLFGVKLQPLVEAMRAMLLTRPVLHADETPVPMLKQARQTHRAYSGVTARANTTSCRPSSTTLPTAALVCMLASFLGSWSGKLVCDDYSGYKALSIAV